MKSKFLAKEIAILFLVTIAGYLLIFVFLEKGRNSKGPWKVTFFTGESNRPAIRIDQSTLGISNVTVSFLASNSFVNQSMTVTFDNPLKKTPIGTVILVDTLYLPGTVVLNLFSNEVQLLPRVLTINGIEYAWVADTNITLPYGKLPPIPGRQYKR